MSLSYFYKTAFMLSLGFFSAICSASNYSGLVRGITVDNLGGVTRVFVTVNAAKTDSGGATCESYVSGSGSNAMSFYFFTMSDSDTTSKAWFTQLEIAKSIGKSVTIEGSGTCPLPTWEGISSIKN